MPDEEKKVTRHPVIDSLLEEADRMDPHLFSPNHPLEPGDTVIGNVTDEYVRRLFSAGTLYLRDLDQLVTENKYSQHDTNSGGKMQELSKRSEVFMALFWFCVRSRLNAWNMEIGVRTEWRVVKCAENPIRDLLRKLGGE